MPSTIYGYLGLLRQQGSVGSLYPVRSSQCMIGRDSDCSVRIHQEYISDRHCIIKSQNDKESTIQNLSTNSCTLLNGTSLNDTESGVLHHGNIITLGERNFVWEYPESSKFWNNPERRYLKISPTTFSPKKTVSLPSKMIQQKVSNVRTNPVKIVSNSSSARRRSQTLSLKPTRPDVLLKKASSQSKLSSSSASGFEADWPPLTPTHKNNPARKKSRAASANLLTETSKNVKFPSKTLERKSSSFKTLAPQMMASLQKRVSEMGLDNLDASTTKFPHTVYGQLAILRPNGAVGSRLPLSTEECTIGRGLECSIRIALSTVSDKQCLISSRKNQESTITNLSKFSSTLLNGKNLGEGTTTLCHGDVITMSERSFRWEYPTSSQFWKKQLDGNANTKLTNLCDKNNPAGLGSKTQKQSVATDRCRVESPSKSSPLKMPSAIAPELARESIKKASKNVPTSKMPGSSNTSNSLLAHLNPEHTSHISMKHASLLKMPPNKKGNKKTPPFPFLKSMPELSKAGSKSTTRKVSSFNGPIPNAKTFLTGKLSDKRNARVATRKSTPAKPKKSRSSGAGVTPRRTSSRDSSCDRSPSPSPPAEGFQPRSTNTINPSLFKGCCFTSSTEKRPKDTKMAERLDSSLSATVHPMRDDEDDFSRSTAGLIDPIYY